MLDMVAVRRFLGRTASVGKVRRVMEGDDEQLTGPFPLLCQNLGLLELAQNL